MGSGDFVIFPWFVFAFKNPKNQKKNRQFDKKCNLVIKDHLLRPEKNRCHSEIRISVKNCIGYIGQIPKNHDFRKFEKPAPSKIEHLVEISMFFMTGSFVGHPDTLTPSSILIFQSASVSTGIRFFKVVPE